MSGYEIEPPTLRERREHQYQLGPCERLADAHARPSAEGEVGELRRSVFLPSGRIKSLGVSPGETKTNAPTGNSYPPTAYGTTLRRPIIHAGGYSRSTSDTTARVYGN